MQRELSLRFEGTYLISRDLLLVRASPPIDVGTRSRVTWKAESDVKVPVLTSLHISLLAENYEEL